MDRKLLTKFCFTLNNYTEAEETAIRDYATKVATFAVVAHETGAEGTPHLQGFINCSKRTRFSAVKKIMPRAHLEPANGTDEQNLTYCSKQDSSPFIVGEPQRAGKRNDLEQFKEDVKAGRTYDDALEHNSKVVARYPKFAKEYVAKVARDKLPKIEIQHFRPWQQEIMDILAQPPHDRHIHWVLDHEGGKGKTFLAKHLVSVHGAFYTNGGKHGDVAYAYQGQGIVIFDFVRETQDYVNYGSIESIKNGILSSNKYESALKTFPTPHVLVFANFHPAMGKLSADRIILHEI